MNLPHPLITNLPYPFPRDKSPDLLFELNRMYYDSFDLTIPHQVNQ